jgi:integrase
MALRKRWSHGVLPLGSGKYLIRVRADRPGERSLKKGKWTRKQTNIKRVIAAASALEARMEQQKLHDEVRRRARGERPTRIAIPTLAEYAERWLGIREARGAKPGTIRVYRQRLNNHVLPHLGRLRLDVFTRGIVQSWADDQSLKSFAPYTLRSHVEVLQALMSDAAVEFDKPELDVVARKIRLGPMHGVRITSEEPNTAPPEVLRRVLDAVVRRESEVRAFVTLLVHTGLRPNEVLALKWTDLDEGQHVIHVVRGISGDEVVDRPKTPNGIRAVALTDEIAVALDSHRKDLLRRQPDALREGWIFPVSRGSGPRRLAWGYFALRAVVKAAGVTKRLTASGLRRAWIDAARRVALDPILVRRVVGHADDSMREWYSTVGADEIAAAGASVARLIRGESGTKSGTSGDATPSQTDDASGGTAR